MFKLIEGGRSLIYLQLTLNNLQYSILLIEAFQACKNKYIFNNRIKVLMQCLKYKIV